MNINELLRECHNLLSKSTASYPDVQSKLIAKIDAFLANQTKPKLKTNQKELKNDYVELECRLGNSRATQGLFL